jgi:hypothetical protein
MGVNKASKQTSEKQRASLLSKGQNWQAFLILFYLQVKINEVDSKMSAY